MAYVEESVSSSPTDPASPTSASPSSPQRPPPTVVYPAAYNLEEAELSALATPTPLTLVTYNVNSLRTLTRRLQLPDLPALFAILHADIVCMQETKASAFADLPGALLRVDGYNSFWAFDTVNKGRNGVVTYARHGLTCEAREGLGWGAEAEEAKAGGIDWTAEEGRVIMTDHTAFVLFNIYFPNAGRGDERLAYKMRFYATVEQRVRQLRASGREVVVVGDVNTAHRPIDIHNPKIKSTGFLPVERDWLDGILLPEPPARAVDGEIGEAEVEQDKSAASDGAVAVSTTANESAAPLLVDVWRWLHPSRVQFSFWDQRTNARGRNRGWRIDFILATPKLTTHLLHAAMHPEMQASDHSPVAAYFDAPVTRQATSGGNAGVVVAGRNRMIEGRLAKGLEDVEAMKGKRASSGGGAALARDGTQKSISSFFGGGGKAGATAVAAADGGVAEAEENGSSEQVETAGATFADEDSAKEKGSASSGRGSKRRKAEPVAAVSKRGKK